jgi:uncharacterized membrane protein YbjE (DUF340 family)
MLNIFLVILSGVATGYAVRKVPFVKHAGRVITLVIALLLFFMGVSVGTNDQVLATFSTIGIEALIITIGGTSGTLLCAWLLYSTLFKKGGEKS